MEKKIIVASKELQTAINHFANDVQENMNLDINKEIIPKSK